MKRLFVTGICTEVGKTVAAAILTEALKADYWKPVQSGSLETTDTETVRNLISNAKSRFHPEAYTLQAPLSPHAAAAAENIQIQPTEIKLPATQNNLIIEGAGGLLVPLTADYFVLDLIQDLKAEVILVSRHYLGSINHTLLSLEILKNRQIPVAGIILNGEPNPATEAVILRYSSCPLLFRLRPEKQITPTIIKKYASEVKANLQNIFI
jgi:dethiobiotin synthetase